MTLAWISEGLILKTNTQSHSQYIDYDRWGLWKKEKDIKGEWYVLCLDSLENCMEMNEIYDNKNGVNFV